MNKEEKKAIENIKALKILFEIDDKKDFEATPSVQKEIAKDLKTLLNLIDKMKICIDILDDELKERNKAINKKEIIIEKQQKENEEIKDQEATQRKINELLVQRYSNSIPIQKIKDQIEDLKMSGGSDGKDNTENTARELVIEVLQDILDESSENKNE